jgi:hypothetical protein
MGIYRDWKISDLEIIRDPKISRCGTWNIRWICQNKDSEGLQEMGLGGVPRFFYDGWGT